ncbi:flagellar hook-length control protein FliK [Paraburkholderia sp. MMS20-SJTR3]|uniref:Flagellar hook-length control protein FliK n=1 Tax=Paraburkholderia sejongensis TaxID=2886946 RepID=A0ABS8JTF9_9BURK|nr:flagellar hook-length control protein FliK [Paraburkholderia sp. MMS20-SJTR3]MCC8393191.1 flagellar hook-length control protein FliK [Paraburkholderia sp. MMS20-SJTR3]
MNAIDSVASVLSSRIDSLLNIAPGAATTSQTGAAGVDTAPANVTPNTTPAATPSAQTALSAVALTLNAIAASGGDATPAVLGQTPIWPAAPALDVAGSAPAASPAASAPTPNAATANTNASATSAAARVAAAEVPVAALAAALERTVGDSGLFYEAHLAAWLSGQRTPAELAGEPQNRLVAGSPAPPGWNGTSGTSGDAAAQSAGGWPGQAGAPPDGASRAMAGGNGGNGAQSGAPAATQAGTPNGPPSETNTGAHPLPSILTAQAARLAAGELLASSMSDLSGPAPHPGLHGGAAPGAESASSQNAQALAAAVHPATVPLVRQQLDLLATGQFRWSGEAWPGARLDWTVEQDGDEWDRSGGGLASEDDQPWRTRLTLSLPTLGTVDAELILTGTRLSARVQASPQGAARLATQGESFRLRLAAAGLDLQGLTIREIGGGMPGAASGAAASQAASAYVRSASAGSAASTAAGARPTPGGSSPARDDFDWEI